MALDLFFIVWQWNLQCLVQPNFNPLLNIANVLGNIANILGNIANAFENNYSALESVSNGLKNVVTHFQCIFNLPVSLTTGFRK